MVRVGDLPHDRQRLLITLGDTRQQLNKFEKSDEEALLIQLPELCELVILDQPRRLDNLLFIQWISVLELFNEEITIILIIGKVIELFSLVQHGIIGVQVRQIVVRLFSILVPFSDEDVPVHSFELHHYADVALEFFEYDIKGLPEQDTTGVRVDELF